MAGIFWVAAGGAAMGGGMPFITSFLSPQVEALRQGAAAYNPVWGPDTTSLINAYNRGLMKRKGFCNLMRRNGAACDVESDDPGWAGRAAAWEVVRQSLLDWPSATFWTDQWVRGIITDDEAFRRIERAGADPTEWMKWRNSFHRWPNAEQLMHAYVRGWLDEESVKFWMKLSGVNADQWFDWSEWFKNHPGIETSIPLMNRGLIDEENFDRFIKATSGMEPEVRESISKLRYGIPGYTDLARMAVREAFNEDMARRLDLDKEYNENPDFAFWMRAQGMGDGYAKDAGGVVKTADWPKMYWRAHWDLPSPTQAYSMLHRLRPTGGAGDGPRDPSAPDRGGLAEVVTMADVRDLLKANDYAPIWRDKLAAISYRVMGRIDAKRVYTAGILGKPTPRNAPAGIMGPAEFELRELFKDQGYSTSTATRLTDWSNWNYWQGGGNPQMRKVRDRLLRTAIDGYEIGTLTEDQVRATLAGFDWPEDAITLLINELKMAHANRQAKQVVATVRQNYFRGAISEAEAAQALWAGGIRADAVNHYLKSWKVERTIPKQAASTARILNYYKRGLLTLDQVYAMLKNLGWSDPEAALQMLAGVQDRAMQIERERAASARTERQRAAALERLLKKIEAERLRVRRELERHSSPARLNQWLTAGIITRRFARERLRLLDWPDDDITRFIAEALDETIEEEQEREGKERE